MRDYSQHFVRLEKAIPRDFRGPKKGKEPVDVEVENALLKRALGYEYDEITRERAFDPETGEARMVETKRVTKQVLPDTTAQIFWLKNRRPDLWRDKTELAHEIEGLESFFSSDSG